MRKKYPYIAKSSFLLFLVFSFLLEFVPVYPVYMIIFDSRGYGFTGLSWLMVIWCVPVVLLEFPSGVLADRLSRKALIAGGMGFKVLCYLLWSVSSSYAAAALGFVCWGIQEAFCSGSRQALLYENLRDEGHEADYEAAAGLCGAASTAGVIAALVCGGLIYAKNPDLPAILSVCTTAAGLVSALCLRERPRRRTAGNTGLDAAGNTGLDAAGNTVIEEARDAGRPDKAKGEKPREEGTRGAFRAAHGLRALMAAAFLSVGAYGLVDEYDGLWAVRSFGIPVAFVGFWSALRFACDGVGGLAAGGLSRFFARTGKIGLSGALAASGLLLILSTLVPGPARFLPYFAYYFSMAAVSVIIEGRMHRAVGDSGRATLLSLSSLGATITSLVLSPLFGLAADTFGFRWIMLLTGFAGIAAGTVFLFGPAPTERGRS